MSRDREAAAVQTPASEPAVAKLDIIAVQAALKADGIDAWLLYDFRGLNPIACDFTGVGRQPELHKEPLAFDEVHPTQRSYK